MQGQPPEAMASVTLLVNTTRMRRRITDLLVAQGAAFLPRIRLITDVAGLAALPGIPEAVPPLRRRLQLAQLIERLMEAQPDIAPRAALYDLADSLASLMDEMHGEGVDPNTIAGLDVSDHSAHWQRTQAFMAIVLPYFSADTAPDAVARLRLVTDRLVDLWQTTPPKGPVLIAGSTGSRGTTFRLMQAVAALPQGAIILPGFDFDLPLAVWSTLADALTAEDHPQYRFHRLMTALGLSPVQIKPWSADPAPAPARNRLVSLSLRPAPVTDQWLTEGPGLGDLVTATQGMTLIEAPTPRAEALAIALILREAAENGQKAALISPDRGLTRQVTAALDRWRILPDDSAGRPLALSPPGRLLRHIAALFGQVLTAEGLLAILKHPLTCSAERGDHILQTQSLEKHVRRHGPAFPKPDDLRAWAAAQKEPPLEWAEWLARAIDGLGDIQTRPLADHVAHHLALTESLAAGPNGTDPGELWKEQAGIDARAAMQNLHDEAPHGGAMTPADYNDLFTAILSAVEVRETVQSHPGIMIWGTLEARVQGADLVILGGLNDGIWPQLPPADPWLNRQMRLKAGLLLPERRIGLSAHDYQQAIGAPRVVLTRAARNAEAETVASRWLNRLTNLTQGLPATNGPAALAAMKDAGNAWLAMAEALETPASKTPSARRPAPRPPVATRPTDLAVTGIKTLIRDPYAIYARNILRLFKLNPLHAEPDARLRGTVLHKVLERFARNRPTTEAREDARIRLLQAANETLKSEVPWPAARALWFARLDRAADFFLDVDTALGGTPVVIEERGHVGLGTLPFTLNAKPDRIDILPDGTAFLYDYKTGTPPSKDQQKHFDKQLLLEAAMVERGAFKALGGPRGVAGISYVGLGSTPKQEVTSIDPSDLAEVWTGLETLIAQYRNPAQGYASRRAVFDLRFPGDYDHLARFGEWDSTDTPVPEDIT
jgi:double-strand break repair protein AddB